MKLNQTIPAMPKVEKSTAPASPIVCHCKQITEQEVQESISLLKTPTVEGVSYLTGAGTGCTACSCRVQRLIEGKASCGAFGFCNGCGTINSLCSCDCADQSTLRGRALPGWQCTARLNPIVAGCSFHHELRLLLLPRREKAAALEELHSLARHRGSHPPRRLSPATDWRVEPAFLDA